MFLPKGPVPTYTWIFENKPKASRILTQQSGYKIAESNWLADEKSPQLGDGGSRLYIYIYRFNFQLN